SCTTPSWTSRATRRRRREPHDPRGAAHVPPGAPPVHALGDDHRVLAVRGRPVRAGSGESAGRPARRGGARGDRGLPPARHADRDHYTRRKRHRGLPRSAIGYVRERGLGAGPRRGLAVVAIISSGTAVRMAVVERSREIAIMRLVGATDGFIRRPFLLQGAIKGLLGGLVAMGLAYGAYTLINRWLIQAAFFSKEQAVALVGFGMLIGFFGSAASVGRHLRRV